ncbi:MAG: hypothetical protein LBU90_02295 [Bacteroidales bacterium]|jgi:hypothetical protein|nr:hypothetical protein [Bacteroidales bacterium]
MENKKLLPLYIMEYCWLIIGISALFVGLQGLFYYGYSTDILMYFIVAILSGFMYFYRRKRRRKLMQEDNI